MIVTILNIKYKLIYGILVYVNGDVFLIVNCYFIFVSILSTFSDKEQQI